MIDIVIIEDEILAAEKLESLLKKISDDIRIVQRLESVERSVNWLNDHPSPDLIFMDIQLDDGISFEILDAIEVDAPIIFTTAYDAYAIQAFKVNSVDYLLKPITREDLERAFNKFRDFHYDRETEKKRFKELFDQLSKSYKTRFFVKVGVHYHTVSIKDIVCFYIQERSTFLKTAVGKNFGLDYSLDQIQNMVDPETFYRINRNYIINVNSISDIVSFSSNRLKVKLKNFEHLDDLLVSRDRTTEFKKWLDK